jgi:hypothetical protein
MYLIEFFNIGTESVKNMKKYLCTTDYEVGDEIRHISTPDIKGIVKSINGPKITVQFEGENEIANTLKKNCFRLIAEVSPNFTVDMPIRNIKEENFKLCLIEGDLRGREMSVNEIRSFVGRNYTNVRAHFKACCGHFH